MRLITIGAGIGVAALALAGCTTGDDGGGQTVDGATFTLALGADPGSLDPQLSAATALYQVTQFAYDSLLSVAPDGTIGSGLASDWTVDGTTVSLTLHDDITCSDGTPFTAEDVAANIAWIEDPENLSPFLGVFIPAGATATADGDSAVTIELASPSPFILNSLASLPIICGSAIDDREQLTTGTLGTGPYVLTEAAQGDQYTYELRDDYTWGPGGVTSEEPGLPAKVVIRIITNETTSANLILSGEVNAGQIIGADQERLKGANLFSADTQGIVGEMWFNQTEGRPGADQDVRLALTQGVDLAEVGKVLTSGTGGPGTTFAAASPAACSGSAADAIPEFDVDAAAALLDDAGWTLGSDGVREKDGVPLELTFLYDTGTGDAGSAAAELSVAAWTDLGAKITLKGQDETALVGTIFGSGDWDISWVPLNVSSPDQLVSFMSGPAAPDGTNFAHIDNADYTAKVAEASEISGTDGCDTWLEADRALIEQADVIPFANTLAPTFGNGAEFENAGNIIPTSIRMLAQ